MTKGESYTKWKCRKGHKVTTALPAIVVTCHKCDKVSPNNQNLMEGTK